MNNEPKTQLKVSVKLAFSSSIFTDVLLICFMIPSPVENHQVEFQRGQE